MRRLIAFLLSVLISLVVLPIAIYVGLSMDGGHLLGVAEVWAALTKTPIWALVGLGFMLFEAGQWFYRKAVQLRWVIPATCGAFVLLLIGAFVTVEALTVSPEASLQAARTAYLEHDLAGFKEYVDVDGILKDGVDQIVVLPALRHASKTDDVIAEAVAGGLAIGGVSWRDKYVPRLADQIEQFVVSGSLPDQSNSDALATAVSSELLRGLVVTQLTFNGFVRSEQVSDSEALVTVQVQGPVSNPIPVDMSLKLRSEGLHWKVVSIQNLPSLLSRLANGRSDPQ